MTTAGTDNTAAQIAMMASASGDRHVDTLAQVRDALSRGRSYTGGGRHDCRGSQLFGFWGIQPDKFAAMGRIVQGMRIAEIAALPQPQAEAFDGDRTFELRGDIAIIELNGPMTKYSSSFQSFFGGTSTLVVRRQLRAAVNDEAVAGILLVIDSPGGMVEGTTDLADDVAAASEKKPIFAFAEDLAASAAYWVGAQADRFTANGPAAVLGSIGVFTQLVDSSKAAEEIGLRYISVATSKLKATGAPGVPIDDDQIADVQRVVDDIGAAFETAVTEGRGLTGDRLAAVATGQVFLAPEAQRLGLIDAVESIDATISQLRTQAGSRRQKKEPSMSTTTKQAASAGETAVTAVTIQQLKAEFPDADADFRESCLEQGLDMAGARGKWMDHLRAQLEGRDTELAELKKSASARGGHPPIGGNTAPGSQAAGQGGDPPSDDPVVAFSAGVARRMERDGLSRQQAIKAQVHADPEGHRAYLEATNPGRKAKELIAEKFEEE